MKIDQCLQIKSFIEVLFMLCLVTFVKFLFYSLMYHVTFPQTK